MAWQEPPEGHVRVFGRVVRGHEVAGGPTSDPRFPDGTLVLQWPLFEELGLDLAGLHRATVNVATGPVRVRLTDPAHTFRHVRWHPDVPPEDFSFVPCRVTVGTARPLTGWVYHPHPETKPAHHQPDDVLELLLPFAKEIHREAVVAVDLPAAQVAVDREPGVH
jgi:hypothetical protein